MKSMPSLRPKRMSSRSLEAEEDVLAVLFGNRGKGELGVGNVHALLLGKLAAVLNAADHVLPVDLEHRKADEAVVDEDGAAHVDLARELQVVEVEVLGGAQVILRRYRGGNRNRCPLLEADLGVSLEKAGADLGALGVEKNAHRLAQLGSDALDALHAHMVLLMVHTILVRLVSMLPP